MIARRAPVAAHQQRASQPDQHFATIEDLEDAQFAWCAALQRRPDLIRSTTRFRWWPKRIAICGGPRRNRYQIATAGCTTPRSTGRAPHCTARAQWHRAAAGTCVIPRPHCITTCQNDRWLPSSGQERLLFIAAAEHGAGRRAEPAIQHRRVDRAEVGGEVQVAVLVQPVEVRRFAVDAALHGIA